MFVDTNVFAIVGFCRSREDISASSSCMGNDQSLMRKIDKTSAAAIYEKKITAPNTLSEVCAIGWGLSGDVLQGSGSLDT